MVVVSLLAWVTVELLCAVSGPRAHGRRGSYEASGRF
jgi:hypothetical protein